MQHHSNASHALTHKHPVHHIIIIIHNTSAPFSLEFHSITFHWNLSLRMHCMRLNGLLQSTFNVQWKNLLA